MENKTKYSNCCTAFVGDDSDVCSSCGEHCEPIIVEELIWITPVNSVTPVTPVNSVTSVTPVTPVTSVTSVKILLMDLCVLI